MSPLRNSKSVFPDLFPLGDRSSPNPQSIPVLHITHGKTARRGARRERKRVFGIPKRPDDKLIFLVSFMVYLLGIFPSILFALPVDGTVRGGSARINQPSSKKLVIHQGTDKAIIDWRGFGIQSGEHVEFQLPSAGGVTLNRVTGGERSDILGHLSSNGNFMLVNPNGVFFGPGSRIDVHGLIATTSDIANEDFMAGRYNFSIPSPVGGLVVNRGRITASQGGLVALVAPGVQNDGVILARLGRVTLASGTTFTLDLYGDQLVNLGIDGRVAHDLTGLDGKPLSSLVSNSGSIFADGGRVRLDVNAARDVVDNVINMSGIIQARTAVEQNGSIVLLGGDEGRVRVSGTLDASGTNPEETGGTVHVFGDRVGLFGNARINISGDSGGGIFRFGGGYQGKGPFPTAGEAYVGSGVSILADAISYGDGGRTIIWADRRTRFFGRVRARGGRLRGNGGFVEVSGKEELFFDGLVDTSAPNGVTGTLLLDPDEVIIANGSGSPSASGAITFTTFEKTLEALSGTTNVQLTANNSVRLNNLSDNVLSFNISGSVTFTAINGSIIFDDPNDKIQTNGSINFSAGGSLNLGSLDSNDSSITLKGSDLILGGTINSGAANTSILSSNGGTIGLGATAGTMTISGAELQNITAANLTLGNATNGGITVDNISAANSANIAGTVTLNATAANASVTFANAASTFNALTVNAGNGIAVNQSLTADAGGLTLNGNSDNSGGGAISLAAGSNLTAATDLTLTAATGGVAAAGNTTFSANRITLNNAMTAAGTASLNANNGITLNAGITSSGNLSLDGDANNAANGGDKITLASGVTLASTGGGLTLDATNGGISAAGAVTLNAANGLTVNDSFTSSGSTTLNADTDNNGSGVFTLAAGKSLSTGNSALSLTAADAALNGTINSGAANTSILSSNGGTIGLGATAGTMTISGAELQNITAANLTLGNATNGGITVDNISAANSANIAGTVTLNATAANASVTFANAASTFNALTVNAGKGVTVSGNLTTQGAATFNTDSDGNGAGSLTVDAGKSLATGNNPLSITTADLTLNGTLNSGTGSTTLEISKDGGTIGLGNGVTCGGACGLTLTQTELGRISAGSLVLGGATNGGITVDGLTAAVPVTLKSTRAGSSIVFTNTASSFGGLALEAGTGGTAFNAGVALTGNLSVLSGGSITGSAALTVGGTSSFTTQTANRTITLNTPANSFTGAVSLTTSGAAGNATLSANNALTLGTSTLGGSLNISVAGGNSLIVNGVQTAGGAITLLAAKDITLTGRLVTASPSAAAVTLTSTGGGVFDGDATGALDIDAANGGLTVDSVTGFGTDSNPIETRVTSVDIDNTTSGDVNIFESDSLSITKINHAGKGNVKVSYSGTLTGTANVTAANGTQTFIRRNSRDQIIGNTGKTLRELSTQKTVNLARDVESAYAPGGVQPGSDGKTVAQKLSGPDFGPFIADIFDENFELLEVARGSGGTYKGLKGFSNFWGPLGINRTEVAKRKGRKKVEEEAKIKKRSIKKKRKSARARSKLQRKHARAKSLGRTAALPQKRSKKPKSSFLLNWNPLNLFK
ncbi:MAG: beta strand repeat-containing protein [Nitrospinaceae bacterium]